MTPIEELKLKMNNGMKNIDLSTNFNKDTNNYKCAFVTGIFMNPSTYDTIVGRMYQGLQYLNSKYSLEILIANTITDNELPFLIKNNIPFKRINIDWFTEDTNINRVSGTLSKFQMLNLTEYDYVCWIDADSIITKNIDYLFTLVDKNYSGVIFENALSDLYTRIGKYRGEFFILSPKKFNYNTIYAETKFKYYVDELLFDNNYFNNLKIVSSTNINIHEDLRHYSGIYKPWDFIYSYKFTEWFKEVPICDFYKLLPKYLNYFDNIRGQLINIINIQKDWD